MKLAHVPENGVRRSPITLEIEAEAPRGNCVGCLERASKTAVVSTLSSRAYAIGFTKPRRGIIATLHEARAYTLGETTINRRALTGCRAGSVRVRCVERCRSADADRVDLWHQAGCELVGNHGLYPATRRTTAFSTSSRLVELNGEAKTARTKQSGATIVR
jgi:hypothetical protein